MSSATLRLQPEDVRKMAFGGNRMAYLCHSSVGFEIELYNTYVNKNAVSISTLAKFINIIFIMGVARLQIRLDLDGTGTRLVTALEQHPFNERKSVVNIDPLISGLRSKQAFSTLKRAFSPQNIHSGQRHQC
jgi:hypothetical protein